MKGIIFGFVLALAGAGMLWGTWGMTQSTLKWKKEGVRVEGTVVDFETHRSTSDGKSTTMYSPVISYATEDGQEFTFVPGSSSSSPGYDRGEKVQVLYSRTTPEKARLDSFMENWLGPLILGLFGLLLGPGGASLVYFGIKRKRIQSWLKANGKKVQARFMGVELDNTYKVNDKSPWRVRADWTDPLSGKVHLLYSDHVWYDPTPYCTREMLDALVNPAKPNEYALDIDFLPKKA